MITLPPQFVPSEVVPQLMDFGMLLRPASGAPALRVNRAGSRFAIQVAFPPMLPEKARTLLALMLKAKREGIRIEFPLNGLAQGGGAAKVDGGSAAGTWLPLKNMTPGFMFRQGVWLTAEAADGTRCLHCVAEPVRVSSDGKATLTIEPPLRVALLDDDDVLLAAPTIEGWITSEVSWTMPLEQIVQGLNITIEEAA